MNTHRAVNLMRLTLCAAVAMVQFSLPAVDAAPRSTPPSSRTGRDTALAAEGSQSRVSLATPVGDAAAGVEHMRATFEWLLSRMTLNLNNPDPNPNLSSLSAPAGLDSSPRRAGSRPRVVGRARSYSPMANNGSAQKVRAMGFRPAAAQPPEAWPADRTSRIFGYLRITADQFTDLPGGQVLAVGSVQIGAAGSDSFYQLSGAHDAVTLTGTSLAGYGTVALIAGNLTLFSGRFTADGSMPQPLLFPVTPTYTLSALGDFPIQDSLVVTRVNLATGETIGWARVRVAPPGIDRAIGVNFSLLPGPLVSGTAEDFALSIAGTTVTATGASLSNQAITRQGVTLTLPGQFGRGSGGVGFLKLTPNHLTLAQSETLQQFSLPEIVFGSGDKLKITAITGSLTESTLGYRFNLTATLALNLPSGAQNIGVRFSMDDAGISGTLDAITLHFAGCTLTMTHINLGNDGLAVGAATLSIPGWLGGASASVQDVTITRDGLRFGGGASLAVPDIKFGDGSILSIVNIQATLVETGSLYVFTARGDISMTLSGKSLAPIPIQFLIDSHGYLSGSLDRLVLALAGGTLAMDNLVLDTTGLSVDAAILTLPKRFGGASVGVQDVSISRGGLSIGCGIFRVPDISFGTGDKLKITDIKFTFTESEGFYQFEAGGTLVINLPQNALSPIAMRFVVDSDGDLSGTVSPFTLRVADAALSMGSITLDNDGLGIISSTLALGTRFGAVSVDVQHVRILSDGLHLDGAEIDWPDIKFGSGNTARITDIKALIAETAQGYVFQGDATMVINLPQNGQTIRAQFTVDLNGDLSGTVDQFKLTLAGCALAVSNITLNNSGLAVGTATLTLPPWSDGASVNVTGITITDQGLRIDGGVNISLPNIAFGDAVKITGLTATIHLTADVYTFDVNGTLHINLPRNLPPPIPIHLAFDSDGNVSGSVQQLSLTLAGCGLTILNLQVGNTGLTLGDGRLALPNHLGGGYVDIRNVAITRDGLVLNGGVTIILPDIKFGSGNVMRITNATAILTQNRTPTDTVYLLSANGTLSLTLPKNALSIPTLFTLDTDGHVSGTVVQIQVRLAGCVLSMNSVTLNNDGLWVETASLRLPHALRDLTVTVRQVSISVESGLKFGMAIALPDIRIGGVVNFVGMQAFLQLSAGPLLTLGISGALALRIPFNTQDIHFLAQIDDAGRFSGSIDQMSLKVPRGLLALQQVGFDNTGLSVSAGTLIISLTRKLPIQIRVHNVKIDGTSPYIHFDDGLRSSATSYPMPDTRVGAGDGFPLTDGQLLLEPGADKAYKMTIAGILSVPVGSQAVNTPVTLHIDSAGQITGRTGGFSAPLAGLTLLTSGADFVNDRLILRESRLQAPADWGSAQARVYNVSITPDDISIGNGAFALPDIQAGQFTLTRLQGQLVNQNGDYIITSAGIFRIPGIVDGADCGIQVSATMQPVNVRGAVETRLELAPAGLALTGVSCALSDCRIPIGQTGVSITRVQGQLTLSGNTTRVQLNLGVVGGLKLGGAQAMHGDMLTATVALQPFSMDLEGRLGVYALFAPSQVTGSIRRGFIMSNLQVDMQAINGNITLSLWKTGAGFEYIGSGHLRVAVARGAIWRSCAGATCIDIPASDQVYDANGELGDLANGAWGWQPMLPFAMNGAVSIGAYLDHNGAFKATSLDRYYRLAAPAWIGSAGGSISGDAPISVSVPITTDVVFAIARSSAVPTLTLISPGGAMYTPDTLPGNMVYQENVLTGTVTGTIGNMEVVTYTQGLFIGSHVERGVWQINLNGAVVASETYLVEVIGVDPAPQLSGVTATSLSPQRARFEWALVSNNPDTGISIHALPVSIPHSDTAFLGFAITQSVATALDGAVSSTEIDLSGLKSGAYTVWIEANDGRNPPVRMYASQPITVQAGWQTTWAGHLSAAAGYRQLTLSWQPMVNPDVDRYRLLVQSGDGATSVVDAGHVYSTTLYNLSPNQPYTLTLEAASDEPQQSARAETIVAWPSGAPFEVEVEHDTFMLNGGTSTTFALTVSTSLSAYPELVGLAVDSAPDGIELLFDTRAVTPTQNGAPINVTISTVDSLPDGVYTASLIATGPGEIHTISLTLTVRQPAFALQVTPATVTIREGGEYAALIGITGLYSATRPVVLGADPTAEGLLYQFDPVAAAPGTTSTLILSNTPLLRRGAYTLQIAGDDGLSAQMVSLTVNVDKNGFGLDAAQSLLIAQPGDTVSAVIDVTSDAWAQPVRVYLDDLSYPVPGATIGLATERGAPPAEVITVTPPARVFLVTALTTATTPGAYLLGVTGDSLGKRDTANTVLIVTAGKQKTFLPMIMKAAVSNRIYYLPVVVVSWAGGLHQEEDHATPGSHLSR